MHLVSVQSGAHFFRTGYGVHWWNLDPQIQPFRPDVALADTISVSENKYNQYKHTTACILNIWPNESWWPPALESPFISAMECVGGRGISILFACSSSIKHQHFPYRG